MTETGGDRAAPTGDLGPRLITAAVGIPALLGIAFWAPNYAMCVLFASAGAAGAWEFNAMHYGGRAGLAGWVSAAGVAAVLAAGYWVGADAVALVTSASVVLVALAATWAGPVERTAVRLGSALGALAYCGVLFGGLLWLTATPATPRHHGAEQAGWMLFPMAVIWSGDTGAYFAGRAWGRHKLAPRLSPKKTWEGSAGGLLASVIGGGLMAAALLPALTPLEAFLIAAPAAALGQAGDLVESALKRSTGVKDSSRLVYGHGGVLDRVDALIFAAPVFVAGKWLCGGS